MVPPLSTQKYAKLEFLGAIVNLDRNVDAQMLPSCIPPVCADNSEEGAALSRRNPAANQEQHHRAGISFK